MEKRVEGLGGLLVDKLQGGEESEVTKGTGVVERSEGMVGRANGEARVSAKVERIHSC